MKKIKYIVTLSLAIAGLCGIAAQANAENVYFYKDNKIIFSEKTENIGNVAYENNKTLINVYDKAGQSLFTVAANAVDYMSNELEAPKADLLDIVFNADGTAKDVSPMKMTVKATGTSGATCYYNEAFGGYVFRPNNPWGGTATCFYRVDYAFGSDFENRIADGHTLEAVVMCNYEGKISDSANNVEVKPFASHQAGGTGLMICKKANGKNGKNEWTFLPNIQTNGKSTWRWATSGVEPENKVYYHLVGVWDKESQKAKIYINGELVNTISAAGNYFPVSDKANWFCIGGDSNTKATPTNGFNGEIVLTRIYDKPLDDTEINNLWYGVKPGIENPVDELVTSVKFYNNLPCKAGADYPIFGEGFANGDKVILSDGTGTSITLNTKLSGDRVYVPLTDEVKAGTYSLTLQRESASQALGSVNFVAEKKTSGADVIAHRGYWDTPGSCQNSRSSLRNAQAIGAYGSETDIWITTDGRLMVNHDKAFSGVTIASSTYDQCKNLTLSNGEKMPTLEDLLDIIKESESKTKLIIEIKEHTTAELNRAAASAAVKAVAAAGVKDKVEYISFSLVALEQVVADDPQAKTAYLDPDYTPAQLHAKGITGIDIKMAEIRKRPAMITEAKNLGMTVNAWTCTAPADIIEMNDLGCQYLTSDAPVDALAIKTYLDQFAE